MHIKFLPHGTGNPQKAVAYLLAAHDHNGIERPEVRVLRGNPKLVGYLAESLTFVHRYTSGVISWHSDDDPSQEDVQAVLDDFERVAFAGMDPDHYSCAAISHGGHVHIFAARVELRTGLSHNMAPPGRQKAFDHLRDHWNYKMGWARPDDPLRARQAQAGPQFKADIAAVRRVEADELLNAFDAEPELRGPAKRKAAIVEWIRGQVLAKQINSRADVIAALEQVGTLNRNSKDYLSIRMSPDEKPIRLKGTMFDDRFDADAIRAAENDPIDVVPVGRSAPDMAGAGKSRVDLEAAIKRRAIYNRSRYKAPAPVTAPLPVSAIAQVQRTHRADEVLKPIMEKIDDGTGNDLVAEAFRAFEASQNAIRRLALASTEAIRAYAGLDRASQSLERATRIVEHIRTALNRFREDVKQKLGVKTERR